MDASICIKEIEGIVDKGAAYVGPHSDPLAHVYGTASVLRDIASTDNQRENIATVVAEFKMWFKQSRLDTGADVERERQSVMRAIANLKRAYGV